MDAPSPPLYIDRPEDVAVAARALAGGAVVTRRSPTSTSSSRVPTRTPVGRVNLAKGHPVHQVSGSITTAIGRIRDVRLDPDITRFRSVGCGGHWMDALYGAGPFGFRGPAAERLPSSSPRSTRGCEPPR